MKQQLKYGVLLTLIGLQLQLNAQTVDWFTGGNTGLNPTTSFLGTINGVPINYRTNNLLRMRLNHTLSNSINGFPAAPRNGFLGLAGRPDFWTAGGSVGPFSRLHLSDDVGTNSAIVYAQQLGYRPWMRNGITFTGNSDQSYIGHKYGATDDNTDFVVQWSDNPNGSPWGVDRMKFVFSTTYNSTATKGAATLDGLEAMRFWPRNNTEVNIGMGDFAPVAAGDPTERLDILDGKVRIRQLPSDAANNTLTKVLVVDDSPSPSGQRGVIKWRDVSTLNLNNCDWVVSANEHVVTAYNGMPCLPDDGSGVGIGLSTPKAKLDVYYSGASNHGLSGNLATNSQYRNASGGTSILGNAATYLSTQFGSGSFYGVHGQSGNAPVSFGVFGDAAIAIGSPTVANVVCGVVGNASGNGKALTAVGVQGKAVGGTTNWAGLFNGNVQITGQLWNNTTLIFSDEGLKTGIEALDEDEVRMKLVALRPRSYTYNIEQYPSLNFPTTEQLGFIAQEVEEVLPQLVSATVIPAELDTLGNVITPAVSVSGVNYIGVIPLLVAGYQTQQRQIEQMAQQLSDERYRLDALEATLASCCANPNIGDTRLLTDPEGNLDKAIEGDARSLHIQPNPFTERTTLYYRLERAGRMQLLANSADGKALKVLQDASLDAGDYQFNWESGNLTPGVYYITLLLDGEPIVKKAVKVDR